METRPSQNLRTRIRDMFHRHRPIDDPSVRKTLLNKAQLAQKQVIEHGALPDCLYNAPTIVWSNYPEGSERRLWGEPDLKPTGFGLVALSYFISQQSEENRLLALARKNALQKLPRWSKALAPAVLFLDKDEKGNYRMKHKDKGKLLKHLQEKKVVWLAPAATTDRDGMKEEIDTLLLSKALEDGLHFVVLAMITGEIEGRRVITELKAEEISLPKVEYTSEDQKKELSKTVCHAIGLYAMAQLAKLLPNGQQKGVYDDTTYIDSEIKTHIVGLRAQGVIFTGGFVEELDNK